MSRSPIDSFPTSNGHGRRQAGFRPVARQSNLIVKASQTVRYDSLRALLREQCLKQNPADTRALVMLARAEAATGKTESALNRLRPYANAPGAPESILAEQASIAMIAGDSPAAAASYRQLTDRYPARAAYRVSYADSLALLGRVDDAAAQYLYVQKAAPSDLTAWLHYAALRSSQGRFAESFG